MHLQRVLSAVALLPPFVLLVQYGTPLHFFFLVSLAILVGLYEFYSMAARAGVHAVTSLGMAGGLALAATQFFGGQGAWGTGVVSGSVIVVLISLLAGGRNPKDAASRAAVTLLGMVYIGGLLAFPALLRAMEAGRVYVFYLVLVTWAGDVGAFYVGRTFGRRPLSPSISERKTVEGGVGGLLSSVLVSYLATLWLWRELGTIQSLSLGMGLGVIGQVGDLCESMLKRSFGVKDAGALIPGHGGLLDRLDSLLFTGPALYVVVSGGWV
jgi:phosphatidate cytidylyltransferase